ncbi:MAG: DUF305 domain-containing protein [Desulfomonilia bacterium]|nr:DUF305 domain-containing protein [Desulfomonilia bacterium]
MKEKRMILSAILVLAMAVGGLSLAFGQNQQEHGKTHQTSSIKAEGEPASTLAYRTANDTMHKAMDIAFTGDADIDFLKGMIPHHQGAIEMAQIVLRYGKDPKIRALAQDIITNQNEEIARMRSWLKERDHGE